MAKVNAGAAHSTGVGSRPRNTNLRPVSFRNDLVSSNSASALTCVPAASTTFNVKPPFEPVHLRIVIPPPWAPRVEAREDPAGTNRVNVTVRVTLPPIGRLIAYDGSVEIEDVHP